MSWLLRHPRYGALNRFADGELDSKNHARVARHLADCARCRAEVIFIRNAGRLAGTLDAPPAPGAALSRALERRREGERALIPLGPPGSRPDRATAAPLVAAFLTLFLLGLFVSARILEADDPGLRFEPRRPHAGEVLRVEYTGGQLFADQSVLRLRGRYYTPGDRRGSLAEHTLRRDGEVFRGAVSLPDSVRFAVFAVEDLNGRRLDSNRGELWEVLTHEGGRPTADALAARVMHYARTDPGRAARAAATLTDRYPDEPRSWTLRLTTDLNLSEPATATGEYARQQERFQRRLAGGWTPTTEERAWLALMALALDDDDDADAWLGGIETDPGGARVIHEARTIRAVRSNGHRTGPLLAALDSLWTDAGVPIPTASELGWKLALLVGSEAEAERWLPRYRRGHDWYYPASVVAELAEAFGPAYALRWGLENRTRIAGSEPIRPLTVAAPRHDRLRRRDRQRVLASLARLARSVGDLETARALALEATDLAWCTQALADIGHVLLAAGDSGAALEAFARAAADPVAGDVPAVIRASPRWPERLEHARSELARDVMTDAVVRFVRARLTVPGTGERVALRDAMGGGPGVVAFLSRCGPHIGELEAVGDRLRYRVDDPGTLIVIATGADRALPSRLRDCGLEADVFTDPEGEVRVAFHNTGHPQYFVLGPEGRVRFEDARLAEIPRQLAALDRASRRHIAD